MPQNGDEVLAGAVVLVIEDDAMQLMAMQMLLESWGCRVLAAASGVAAQQTVAQAAEPPQVIVSDFRLPDNMSGTEAVGLLRERIGRLVPAVLQTGDTDPALVREAAAQGYAMLHKPYDPNQLRALLVSLLAS